MSGNYWRKGSRLCFYGLLENRSVTSNSSPAEIKQWGSLARSPLLKQSRSKFSSFSSSTAATTSKNGFIGWYLGMIESRPILTKSVTAGFIFTAADVSSQMITLESSDSFDPIRTMRMAGYGLLFSGPTLHLWFNTISRTLPKRDLLTTMKKLFIGQTVYGPIMTAVFFSVNAGLQGKENLSLVLYKTNLSYKVRIKKLINIINPRLEGVYPFKGVHKAAMLAYHCLNCNPKARPLMRDIVDSLESLQVAVEVTNTTPFVIEVQSEEV